MNSLGFAVSLLALAFASLAHGAVKNVVLVHGAFADGSGWKAVADILQHDGYTAYVVQEPETTRFMSSRAKSQVIELQGSHAIFLTHPKEVASLIEKAAD